jgi:hypothetical protein
MRRKPGAGGAQVDAMLKALLDRPLRAEVDTPVKRR